MYRHPRLHENKRMVMADIEYFHLKSDMILVLPQNHYHESRTISQALLLFSHLALSDRKDPALIQIVLVSEDFVIEPC